MANETEQLVVSLEARINQFEKSFERANRTAATNWTAIEARGRAAGRRIETDMAKSTGGIVAGFNRMGAGITRALALSGVTIGVSQLARSVRGVVSEAAGLVDTADKIGVTTKALQELRFAAKQAGVESGQFDNALAFFSKTLGDASRGGGELYKILKLNGIALRDEAGKMRSVSDLFRDYAGLVARAASVQERNTLVTTAFGKSADEMGNLFSDGAAGIDKAVAAAERLGLVIDDDKLRRIAAMDDRWDAFAQTLETRVKSAVLDTVDAFDALFDRFSKLEDQQDRTLRSELESIYGQRSRLQDAIAQAQKGNSKFIAGDIKGWERQLEELADRASTILDVLNRRQGYVPPGEGTPATSPSASPAGPTPPLPRTRPAILPPSGTGSGGAGTDPQKAIQAVIEALRFEGEQLGRTATQQEIYNRLKAAGVALDSKEGQAIAALVQRNAAAAAAIENLNAAQQRFNETGSYFGEGIVSALDAILIQGENAGDVIGNLTRQLASAALQAALLGTGPLANLFGGGTAGSGAGLLGGGLLGGLGKLIFGGFLADGGPVAPNRAYVVGERRPELFVPNVAGRIVPSVPSRGGGNSTVIAPTINVKVEGGSKGEAADRDFAKRIGDEVQVRVRDLVLNELRRQIQPGGMLR